MPVGSNPEAVAVNPMTNKVYATNELSGTVTVIDVGVSQAAPLTIDPAGTRDALTVNTTNVFETMNPTPSFTAAPTPPAVPTRA
jgi:DNA-binding beta-propeller fold protein YncE